MNRTAHCLLGLCLVISSLHLADALVCYKGFKPSTGTCRRPTNIAFPSAQECCSSKTGKAFYQNQTAAPGQAGRFLCTPCDEERTSTSAVVYETTPPSTPAPVHGGWGKWSCWGPCSPSCGTSPGRKARSRQCDNPSPQHGGQNCEGVRIQNEKCDIPQCPVDGSWSVWQKWFSCSESCDGGTQYRMRLCDNPRPEHGGKYCEGDGMTQKDCNTHPCPVDGAWTKWSDFGPCSVSCGSGQQVSTRTCIGVQHNGNPCEGQSERRRPCNLGPCPVDGYWENFGDWGDCSRTCETGLQTRTRQCVKPKYGGQNRCVGSNLETRPCVTETKNCPVHGGWSSWGQTRRCSAPHCGGPGKEIKFRKCNNPKPQYNGDQCKGLHYNWTICYNNEGCPVDGSWCAWTPQGECRNNRQMLKRECLCPSPQYGGKECKDLKGYYRPIEINRRGECIKNSGGCGSGDGSGSGDGLEDQECDQSGSGSGSGDGSDADAEG